MFTEDQTRELAYTLWEQEGRPTGKDLDNYFRARQILDERETASPSIREPLTPAAIMQPLARPKPNGWHPGKYHPKIA
jgi:hypothetical protein